MVKEIEEHDVSVPTAPALRANRRKTQYVLSEQDDNLLAQLPVKHAEILRQEGSLEEIATRLRIPIGTVKSRTHRARAALDELIAREKPSSH